MFFESFFLNLAVLIVLLLALVFDFVTKFFSYWYVRHIPYKQPIPFFGSDYHRVLGLRGTTDEVNTLCKQHGNEKLLGLIKSRIPDLIVKDPEIIKLLMTISSNFNNRGVGLDNSQDICLKHNLFYAEGEKWNLLRENLESILKSATGKFEQSERSVDKYLQEVHGEINVRNFLENTMDGLIKDLLFGKLSSQEESTLSNLRWELQDRSLATRFKSYLKNVFPSLFVLFNMNQINGNLDPVLKTLEKSDLLKDIKNLQYLCPSANNKRNKNQEVVSESDYALSVLTSFITEGYIPCLNIIACLIYELSKDQKTQEKIRSSKLSVDKDSLDYAVKETLRLYPQYSILTRKCTKTYKFEDSDLLIDRGVTVSIPVEMIHKDPKFFPSPNTFNPDRFSEMEKIPEFAFLGYGVGSRRCVGENLSQKIIKAVIEAILRKYKIESCGKTPQRLVFKEHNFGQALVTDIYAKFVPIQ